MFLLFFLWQKSHPKRSPESRRKLIVNKSSISNQETQPSPSLPASTTTSKADESERDRLEIRRLKEELGNVLRLKGSLERDLSILKFGLKRFKESEKDMIFYTGLAFGQFVALFILKQVLPNSMAEGVDKIWKVCCLLANFQGPLVV